LAILLLTGPTYSWPDNTDQQAVWIIVGLASEGVMKEVSPLTPKLQILFIVNRQGYT